MTIQEMYEYMGYNRELFAAQYSIPEEVLEEWEADSGKMPDYVRLLLERVMKEDRAERKKQEALEKLYAHIDHPVSQSKWDVEFGYLTEETDKDGEAYWVYKDEMLSAAIKMSDASILDRLADIHALFDKDAGVDYEQLELDSILKSQSFL